MKKSLLFIVGIIICLFVIDRAFGIVLDFRYNKNFKGETGGNINHYISLESTPEMLILGSSRSHRHVIPDSFTVPTYNLSHHGMRLPFNASLISILNQKNKMPKKLLLHIENGTFVYFDKNKPLGNSQVKLLSYFYDQNEMVTKLINSTSKYEKYKYLLSSYRFNGKIPSLIFKNKSKEDIPDSYDGFEPLMPSESDSIRMERQLANMTGFVPPNDWKMIIDQSMLAILDSVIVICKSSNTELIIFSSPIYTGLRESDKYALEHLKKYFLQKNIQYIPYVDGSIAKLSHKKYWRDFEHMNFDGAKIFTSSLKKKIGAVIN